MSDVPSSPHSSKPPSLRVTTPTSPNPPSSSTSIDIDISPDFVPPVSTGVPLDASLLLRQARRDDGSSPPPKPSTEALLHPESPRLSWRKKLRRRSSYRPSTSGSVSTKAPSIVFVADDNQSIATAGTNRRKKKVSMAAAMSLFSYLKIPIAATSALVASLSGLLYWKQNELIYPRHVPPGSRTEVPRPSDFPEYNSMGEQSTSNWEELYLPTPDGETLHGFLMRSSNPVSMSRNVTVIMFHGNAGNIGHRLPIAGVLDLNVGCNVLMLEYRGYGLSTGVPDEVGLNIDSQVCLDYVRSRDDLKKTQIVIYGQSLGGAVAIQLVARNEKQGDIAGLILENTFLNIRKLIPHAFPPAKYLAHLCHQIWPSDTTIPEITVPVLFLSGLHDEIVPCEHMAQLHKNCTARRKFIRTFPRGQHNNTVAAYGYFDTITSFIEDYIVKGL